MANLWTSSRPIRGSIPPDPQWPYGGRQVVRAGMRTMYFNVVSKAYDVPRRARRKMARAMAARVYRETMAEIKASPVKLVKPETWWERLRDKLGLYDPRKGAR